MNYILEIIILVFISITFLQSGYDKIADWKGNIGWLKSHFADTFFSNKVPFSLGIILILEIISGLLALIGIGILLTSGSKEFALLSAIFSCITLLFLLLGQRVAKDYDGARTIVIYFIPIIFLLFLLK